MKDQKRLNFMLQSVTLSKNVRLSVIVLLLTQFSIFGQPKPQGIFCSRNASLNIGSCWTFKNDSLFEYKGWSDVGGGTGKGVYKLENKCLTLYFKDNDITYPSIGLENGVVWKYKIKILYSTRLILQKNNYDIELKKEKE